jgi:hypothetical protein
LIHRDKTRGAEQRYKEIRKTEKRISRKKKKEYFEGKYEISRKTTRIVRE